MLFPFSTLQLRFLLNQIPSSFFPQMLLKSLHHLDSPILLPTLSKLLQDPYFDLIISLYKPSSFVPNLHFHLPRRALLNFSISLILNPPHSLVLQTVLHLIRANFFLSQPQPLKNCR